MPGQPAARFTDMHTCPASTGPVPHVGGPILPFCAYTVHIGGFLMFAARMGDYALCVGPPDSIVKGAFPAPIENKAASRMTDNCAHGGLITGGCPNVLIGLSGTTGNPVAGNQACQNAKSGRNPPPGSTTGSGAPLAANSNGQSYNNCGIESSRQIINQANGSNISQEGLYNQAMGSTYTQGGNTFPITSQPAVGSTQPGGTVVTPQNQAFFGGGTTNGGQSQLLANNGVPAGTMGNASATQSILDIQEPLMRGDGVIAAIDVGAPNGLPNWAASQAAGQTGGHAILITGMDYDDNGNVTAVHYNDTGTGHCNITATVAQFNNNLNARATVLKNAGFPNESMYTVTNNPIW